MEKLKKRKRKKYEIEGCFFILPSLIGVSIFILIPFADVVIRSFQSPIVSSNKHHKVCFYMHSIITDNFSYYSSINAEVCKKCLYNKDSFFNTNGCAYSFHSIDMENNFS